MTEKDMLEIIGEMTPEQIKALLEELRKKYEGDDEV